MQEACKCRHLAMPRQASTGLVGRQADQKPAARGVYWGFCGEHENPACLLYIHKKARTVRDVGTDVSVLRQLCDV